MKPGAESPGGAQRGLTWGPRGSSAASTGPVSLFNSVSTRWIISRIRLRNPARSEGRMNSLYTWQESAGRGRAQLLHSSLSLSAPSFKNRPGVPIVAQWKLIRLVSMRRQVRSLAALSGLRIQCCRKLCCRLQTRFRSHVAVAVVQMEQQLSFDP